MHDRPFCATFVFHIKTPYAVQSPWANSIRRVVVSEHEWTSAFNMRPCTLTEGSRVGEDAKEFIRDRFNFLQFSYWLVLTLTFQVSVYIRIAFDPPESRWTPRNFNKFHPELVLTPSRLGTRLSMFVQAYNAVCNTACCVINIEHGLISCNSWTTNRSALLVVKMIDHVWGPSYSTCSEESSLTYQLTVYISILKTSLNNVRTDLPTNISFWFCLPSTMQQYKDLKFFVKIRHCTTCFGLLGHHQMRWNSGELLCLPRYCDPCFRVYSVSKWSQCS
jgi:hypothetical protein